MLSYINECNGNLHTNDMSSVPRPGWRLKRPDYSFEDPTSPWGSRYKTPMREPTEQEFENLADQLNEIGRLMTNHRIVFDIQRSNAAMNLQEKLVELKAHLARVQRPMHTFTDVPNYSVDRAQERLVFVGDMNKFVEDVTDFGEHHSQKNEQLKAAWRNDAWDLSLIEYNVKKLVREMAPMRDKHELPVNPMDEHMFLQARIVHEVCSAMHGM
jgi:hypothetical protein